MIDVLYQPVILWSYRSCFGWHPFSSLTQYSRASMNLFCTLCGSSFFPRRFQPSDARGNSQLMWRHLITGQILLFFLCLPTWHLQIRWTILFSFAVSYLNKCKPDWGSSTTAGVIVGNWVVFPNIFILATPRQFATYSTGFVETRHHEILKDDGGERLLRELFRGCTRLEPFAKRLGIPFQISVSHSSLESRLVFNTTRAPYSWNFTRHSSNEMISSHHYTTQIESLSDLN